MMQTLVTVGVLAFIAWNERSRLASLVGPIRKMIPGLSSGSATVPTRMQAVEAVENLLAYAKSHPGCEGVEHSALEAGRALFDCPHHEPSEAE